MDLDSKQTISLHLFCFLPPAPSPPQDCYEGHPLPSVPPPLCPPRRQGGMVGRQGRCGLRRVRGLSSRIPGHRYLLPSRISRPPVHPSLCSRLPPAPAQSGTTCAGMYRRASCGLCGCLRCCAWLAACPSLCVSLPSKAHPTHLLSGAEAASGFPSTAWLHPACCSRSLLGSCVSLLFQARLCSPKPHGL